MPKISESPEDILRTLLDQGALDERLRKILGSQTFACDTQELPPLPASAATAVHRVKVSLHGARPPVWRRIEIPSDMSLDLVHEVLQTAFGWYDCHLHQFESACGEFAGEQESGVAIGQVAAEVRAKVCYVYDFGDDWRHDIVVEDVRPAAPAVSYPRCTGGRGLPPAENSGGIWAHNESGQAGGGPVDSAELTRALSGLARVLVPTPLRERRYASAVTRAPLPERRCRRAVTRAPLQERRYPNVRGSCRSRVRAIDRRISSVIFRF